MPLQPNGQGAKANDPATWRDYRAASAFRDDRLGIGFVFSESDAYLGIDLDDAYNAGELLPWAQEIVDRFEGAYIERSPSGEGLHIICRGTKPATAKSNQKLSDGGAVECYDRGRYFTITGDCIGDSPAEIPDCQPAIDWLAKEYLTKPAPPKPEPNTPAPISPATYGDSQRRAAEYLATVDPAVSGCGGHSTTYRAAMAMVEGFALPADQAYALLATEYNPRCLPPWSERELRHKIDDALKNAGKERPIGHLLNSEPSGSGADVDISGLMEAGSQDDDYSAAAILSASEASELPEKPGKFPEHLLEPAGFLGCVASWITRTAYSPRPVASLAAALCAAGVLYGRRVAGPRDIRTNLMSCTLIESGGGKDHPMKSIARLLEAGGAGGDQGLIGSNDVCSKSGIIAELQRKPAVLLALDEIGELLSMIAAGNNFGQYAGVPKLLRTLSTSAADTYRDGMNSKGEQRELCQPCLVIAGASTRGQFYDALNKRSIEDGLIGRLLVFDDGISFPEDDDELRELSGPPSKAVDSVDHWFRQRGAVGNMTGTSFMPPVNVSYTAEAADRIKQHRKAIRRRQAAESEQRATLWGRVNENAARLSLIHSCSRRWNEPGDIELQDVEFGIELANHLAVSMTYAVETTVAESETDKDVKRLIAALERCPGRSMDRADVSRNILKEKGSRRRDALVLAAESRQVGFANVGRKLVLYLPGYMPAGGSAIDSDALARILRA